MGRARERVSLNAGLKLDLNWLMRRDFAKPGAMVRGVLNWDWDWTGERIAQATIVANMLSDADARISISQDGREQVISLCSAARHFGGRQWYFTCPKTYDAVSVLWKPSGSPYFASRQAFGRQVAYASQFQTKHDRALSKAQAIRRRVGGGDCISCLDAFPPKPKGMRWKTYYRQMDRCDEADSFAMASLYAQLRKLAR